MVGERYGFVRDVEAQLIDRTLDRLKKEFGRVDFLEIGVAGGGTATGIVKRCMEIELPFRVAGVDLPAGKPDPWPCPGYDFYPTDSMDAWRDISRKVYPDGFNFLFVDGCHCVNHAMCDFLNYSPFVEIFGYCLFHDTALPKDDVKQGEWPQDHSYAGKPNSVLGVREGLLKLGLLQGYRSDWTLVEELESESGLMGMHLFQKITNL